MPAGVAASLRVERLGGDHYSVTDPGGSGTPHVVTVHDHGSTCDCMAFQFRQRCKHVTAVTDLQKSDAGRG